MCCEIFNDSVRCVLCSTKRGWTVPTFMFSEAPFAISYDAQPSLVKPTIAPSNPNRGRAAFAANEGRLRFKLHF